MFNPPTGALVRVTMDPAMLAKLYIKVTQLFGDSPTRGQISVPPPQYGVVGGARTPSLGSEETTLV